MKLNVNIGDPVYAPFGGRNALGVVSGVDDESNVLVGFRDGDSTVVAPYAEKELKKAGGGPVLYHITHEDVRKIGLRGGDVIVLNLGGRTLHGQFSERTDALWLQMYRDGIDSSRRGPDTYPYENVFGIGRYVMSGSIGSVCVSDAETVLPNVFGGLGSDFELAEVGAGCDIAPYGVQVPLPDGLYDDGRFPYRDIGGVARLPLSGRADDMYFPFEGGGRSSE